MSWSSEFMPIVRTLTNDIIEPYLYSDARINQVIVVAVKYVQADVELDYVYETNVETVTITPDPTQDNDFAVLVCLKTACIIDQSTFRSKAVSEGISVSMGPSSLRVAGSLDGWSQILKHGPCGLYKELIDQWAASTATGIRAVLGPFVGNNFDPRNLNNYTTHRHRDFYS